MKTPYGDAPYTASSAWTTPVKSKKKYTDSNGDEQFYVETKITHTCYIRLDEADEKKALKLEEKARILALDKDAEAAKKQAIADEIDAAK